MSEVIARFEREYLDYHQITKARSHEVVRHLRALEARTGVSIEHVAGDAVRAYVAELAVDRTPPTVGKILGQIRPFFQWAWEAGLIDAERLMQVRNVKPPRGARGTGQPKPYRRDEIAKIWADWNRKYGLPKGWDLERAEMFFRRWENGTSRWGRVKPYGWRLQSRAIICLALMGAIRREEIWRLSVDDLHYDNEYVVVTSARKNEEGVARKRAVPWTTPEMRDAVRDWLLFRERVVPGHDRTWLSMVNTPHIRSPLSFQTFEMLMTRMGRGWEFHRMRHTAATEMLRAGYPLETVQRVMGHATIQQTLAYAELLTEDVVRIAGKCEMNLSAVFGRAA